MNIQTSFGPHACKLATLSTCLAKCVTTIDKRHYLFCIATGGFPPNAQSSYMALSPYSDVFFLLQIKQEENCVAQSLLDKET